MRMRRLTFSLLLIAVATLLACGQKGPLYLPDEATAQPAKKR